VDDGQWFELETDFTEAFRDFGVDVLELPAAESITLLKQTKEQRRIAGALDFWIYMRLHSPELRGLPVDAFREIAGAINPDPVHQRIRKSISKIDRNELEALARDTPFEQLDVDAIVLLFWGLNARNSREAALDLLEKAIDKWPDDYQLNACITSCLMNLETAEKGRALRHAARLIQARGDRAETWTTYAGWLRYAGDYAGARRALAHALHLDPRSYTTVVKLGAFAAADRHFDKARKIYARARELRPDRPGAYLNTAGTYATEERYDEALHWYKEAYRVAPKNVRAVMYLGLCYTWRKEFEKARPRFEQAVLLEPLFPGLHRYLAWLYSILDRPQDSLRVARKAVALDPESWQSGAQLAGALSQVGQLDEAAEILESLIKAEPNRAALWLNYGNVLAENDRWVEAEEKLRKSIRLQPTAAAFGNLSLALSKQGRLQEAADASANAVRYQPKNAWVAGLHALHLLYTGQFAEAAVVAQKGIDLDAKEYVSSAVLANCHLAAGEIKRAESVALSGLRAEPRSSGCHQVLGYVHLKKAQWGNAVARFDRSLAQIGKRHQGMLVKGDDRFTSWTNWHRDLAQRAMTHRARANTAPKNADDALLIAMKRFFRGEHERALPVFEIAMADKSVRDDACTLMYAASNAVRAGKHKQALRWLRADLKRRRAGLTAKDPPIQWAARHHFWALVSSSELAPSRDGDYSEIYESYWAEIAELLEMEDE